LVAPSLSFLQGKFHPEILTGSPSIKQGKGRKSTSHFHFLA